MRILPPEKRGDGAFFEVVGRAASRA